MKILLPLFLSAGLCSLAHAEENRARILIQADSGELQAASASDGAKIVDMSTIAKDPKKAKRTVAVTAPIVSDAWTTFSVTVKASASGQAKLRLSEEFSYKNVGAQELKIYMIAPADWRPSDRRATVIFYHGGSWVAGEPKPKHWLLPSLASQGIVGFTVEYRLLQKGSTEPPIPCIEDARSAFRWISKHAGELGVDSNRIATSGASAGGHLAAFLGMMNGFDDSQDDLNVPVAVSAMILLNPVIDNGPTGFGYQRMGQGYREFSPFHNVSAKAPPALILTGGRDELVSPQMIESFQTSMKTAGVRCDVHIYPDETHLSLLQKQTSDVSKRISQFLQSLGWVKGDPGSGENG